MLSPDLHLEDLAVYDVVMYDRVSRMVRIVELRLLCDIPRM